MDTNQPLDGVIIPPDIIQEIQILQKKPHSNAGRPTVMTDVILQKLKEAYLMDCTDVEACQYAGISKSTLYNYQNDNAEFLEEKELWKQDPFLKARETLKKALATDAEIALKYMERKKKDEFAQRIENTGKEGGAIEQTLDILEKTDYGIVANRAKAAMDAARQTQG